MMTAYELRQLDCWIAEHVCEIPKALIHMETTDVEIEGKAYSVQPVEHYTIKLDYAMDAYAAFRRNRECWLMLEHTASGWEADLAGFGGLGRFTEVDVDFPALAICLVIKGAYEAANL